MLPGNIPPRTRDTLALICDWIIAIGMCSSISVTFVYVRLLPSLISLLLCRTHHDTLQEDLHTTVSTQCEQRLLKMYNVCLRSSIRLVNERNTIQINVTSFKNANQREVDQFVIYKCDRGVHLASTEKQLQLSGQELIPRLLDIKSSAPNTRLRCLLPNLVPRVLEVGRERILGTRLPLAQTSIFHSGQSLRNRNQLTVNFQEKFVQKLGCSHIE